MTHILCLIQASPQRRDTDSLTPDRLETVTRFIGASPRWLAPREAVEFESALPPAALETEARRIFADRPVDIALLPAEGRRKSLFLSDMDSTMITIECIDELADRLNIKTEVAAITRRAMNGEIEFKAALEERVALLSGLAESVMHDICRERVQTMPGAPVLLATLRHKGVRSVLVSGGFKPFTGYVRDLLGFDDDDANELEIKDGKLTGRLIPPLRDAQAKLARLAREADAMAGGLSAAMAVGDGANDLPMVQAAGMGVIFRGHDRVRAAARQAGRIVIDHGDLTALLYLQGYRRSDFIDPA